MLMLILPPSIPPWSAFRGKASPMILWFSYIFAKIVPLTNLILFLVPPLLYSCQSILSDISQGYLSHISGISEAHFSIYLRNLLSVSQAYIRYISGMSQVYLKNIICISQVNLRHISGTSQAHLWNISSIFQAYISETYLRYISDIPQAHLR